MTASQLIEQVFYAYKGKTSTRVPAWGSDKANLYLSIANRKQREYCTDPRNKWSSLFEVRSLTPVIDALTTPTMTYNLPTDFFSPSDYARIVKTDGSATEYPIVKPQQRNLADQSLYISGSNPKTITFAQTIDTGLDGATLYVPGYYMLADLVDSTDTVLVDDPNWLVYATASELARNDAAKDDQFGNLSGMANELWVRMSNANNDTGYLQPNQVVNNMPALGWTSDDWTS